MQALPAPANGSPNKRDQKQAAADSKARSLLQRWAKVRATPPAVLHLLCCHTLQRAGPWVMHRLAQMHAAAI